MFIEFTVGNYRSFFAPMTLSLEATTLQSAEKTLDEQNVFQSGDLRLLRSAAIYGANASGKSNLIRAMAFMRKFVLQSAKESQAGEPTGIERFRLNTAARQEPALFQIIFINAQLIFATHDTGLLGPSLLRRDQIWFTEKDRYGATNLYSLAELQVRNDAAFDKQYIAGRYGAIPFIGGLRSLFEELAHDAKAETQRVAE